MDESDREPTLNQRSFRLSTMFLVTTLLSVAITLTVKLPIVGWVFNVIAVPVFLRTVKIIQFRQSIGILVTSVEKINIFLRTLAVVAALVTVWCVSAVTCLVGLCGMSVQAGVSGISNEIWLFALFLLGVLGVVVASRWNKRYEDKYQQSIGSSERSRPEHD